MQRRELQLQLSASRIPAAEVLLELAGAEVVSLRDAGDDALLEPAPGQTPLWAQVRISALFDAALDLEPVLHALREHFPDASHLSTRLPEAHEFAPRPEPVAARRFGRRLTVVAADQDVPDVGIPVRLNMGLAFGTGAHPTTALCLEWLDAHLTPGSRVIDYGCGSGVLALAALALGARHVLAVDNEPQALIATRDNARLNNRQADLWTGAPEALAAVLADAPPPDLIIANILARPLMELAGSFAAWLQPGGRVVLSGVLQTQLAELEAAYRPWFRPLDRIARDEWVLFEAQSLP